jgi:hypothetical protein
VRCEVRGVRCDAWRVSAAYQFGGAGVCRGNVRSAHRREPHDAGENDFPPAASPHHILESGSKLPPQPIRFLLVAPQLYINLANNSRLDSYRFTPFAVVTSGVCRLTCDCFAQRYMP